MLKHVTGIPATSPLTEAFKEYIELRCPRCELEECLGLLKEICSHNNNGENPRTRELADALHIKGEKVLKLTKAMNPKYVRIYGGKFLIFIGPKPYFDPKEQKRELDKLVKELEDFLREAAPKNINDDLLGTLNSRYGEILELTKGDLHGAVRKYHELIEILDSKGIVHNLRDAKVGVKGVTFIFTIPDSYPVPKNLERNLENIIEELREFFRSSGPHIVELALFKKLNWLYNVIVNLRGQKDVYWTVRKYHELIQILNNKRIIHGLRDARIRRKRIVFILVGPKLYVDSKEQKQEFDELVKKLEDFPRKAAPTITDKALLETLNSLCSEVLELRERDLRGAVRKYNELIQMLYENKIIHPLPTADVGRRGAIFFASSELYFDRQKQEEEFKRLSGDLKKFLSSITPDTFDQTLFKKLNSLYDDIVDLVEQEDLYKAVRKYHGLVQMLYKNRIIHFLCDADVRSTSYRYAVTSEGEDFC